MDTGTLFLKDFTNKTMKYFIIYLLINSTILLAQGRTIEANQLLLADNFEQIGNFQRAKEIYLALYKNDSLNYTYFQKLNSIYLSLKDYRSSENLLRKRLNLFPNDVNVYGLLGSTYYTEGNYNRAFEIWDSTTSLFNNASSYRTISNYALQNRAFDKAIEILTEGEKIAPNDDIFPLDLANLYSVTMNFEKAAEKYLRVLELNPERIELVKSRINRYLDSENSESTFISVLEKNLNNNLAYHELLYFLYLQAEKFNKAFKLAKEIDSLKNTNGSTIYSFAEAALQSKNYDESIKAFVFLINNNNNPALIWKAYQGKINAQFNRSTEKIDSLKKSGWKPLAKRDTSYKYLFTEVINDCNKTLELFPNSNITLPLTLLKADIFINYFKEYERSKEFLENNSNWRSYKDKILIIEKQLEMEYNFGKFEEFFALSDILSNYYKSNKEKQSEINFKKAKAYFLTKEYNQSRKLFASIVKDIGSFSTNDAIEMNVMMSSFFADSTTLTLLSEAELNFHLNNYEEALEFYKSITKKKEFPVVQEYSYYKSAEILVMQDRFNEAIDILNLSLMNEIEGIYSDSSLYLLGKIFHYGLNDEGKSLETFQNFLDKFPNSIYYDEVREIISKLILNKPRNL